VAGTEYCCIPRYRGMNREVWHAVCGALWHAKLAPSSVRLALTGSSRAWGACCVSRVVAWEAQWELYFMVASQSVRARGHLLPVVAHHCVILAHY
jgi:hypothetical protein